MRFSRLMLLLTLATLFEGCQLNYLLKSGYNQALLLKARQPIDQALQDPNLPEEFKRKLRLTQEAKKFAETELHLKQTKNYDSFVLLNRDAVTWAVSAAPRFELSAYLWSFPIVGSVPYKGFFSLEDARDEAHALDREGFDTYVRGVSAYSTLGWFDDPLLSSMLKMSDADLVDTIIHETTHATLYIKSHADFNERLAMFVGGIGAEKFYFAHEGANSKTVEKIHLEHADGKLFSLFLTTALKDLEKAYASTAGRPDLERAAEKNKQLDLVAARYLADVVPFMKTSSYKDIFKNRPNNARLIALKTYYQDLSDFQKAYEHFDKNFDRFLDFCKTLTQSNDPEKDLKAVSGG